MSDLAIAARALGVQLDSFGHSVVARFGALNVWSAVLLGGALVVDRALSRRARASWRIALYAPVALRVLLPLDWRIPVVTAPGVGVLLAPLARIGARPEGELPPWGSVSLHAVAGVVYVAVAVALAARAILARVRLNRALAGAPPAPVHDVDVPCPVVQHEELGPMAVGLLAPRIVLPRRLLAPGEEHPLACVLRHESAHLRRRDAWLGAAMQLLAIAAWPVVPVWIAIARVRQLVELACDDDALAGADAAERRRYGHALLDMAEQRFAVVPLAGAGALHFGSTLRARIEALASQRHWPRAVQALAVFVAPTAMFLACSSATPAASAPAPEGYGYEFENDSPAAAASSPVDAAAPRGPNGRLPPEAIQARVRENFGAFRVCYEAGLARNPKLAGSVKVSYVIGINGATKGIADDHSTMPDPAVVACVIDAFRKVAYPAPEGGEVTVVYPLEFSPLRVTARRQGRFAPLGLS